MKKQIIIGVILSSLILFLTPSIPALQFTLIEDAYTSLFEQTIGKQTMNSFEKITGSQQSLVTSNLQHYLSTILDRLQTGSISSNNQITTTDPDDPQAQFFPFLGIFVYLFIAYVIFKIIAFVFQYLGGIVNAVVGAIVQKIRNLFTAIFNIITAIISLVVTILIGVFNILKKGGEFLLNAIVLILSGILSTILVIISGLIALIGFIWQGIGAFFGVLLDILRIIYEAIFPGITTI